MLFFQSCSIQNFHRAFEPRTLEDPEPFSKLLKGKMTKGDTLVILFDNSPTCHSFSSQVGSIVDSLEKESRMVVSVYSFSCNLDPKSKFLLNPDSVKSEKGFDLHIQNGYGEQNMFQSVIECLDLGVRNKKMIVITDGGLIPHHRNDLPKIREKATQQEVEVTFVFLCETKVLILTVEELEGKIKGMKYPVHHIQFNCSEIEQWGF